MNPQTACMPQNLHSWLPCCFRFTIFTKTVLQHESNGQTFNFQLFSVCHLETLFFGDVINMKFTVRTFYWLKLQHSESFPGMKSFLTDMSNCSRMVLRTARQKDLCNFCARQEFPFPRGIAKFWSLVKWFRSLISVNASVPNSRFFHYLELTVLSLLSHNLPNYKWYAVSFVKIYNFEEIV